MLRGFARNRAEHDLQLQTFDGRIHLLTDADYAEITRETAIVHAATEGDRRRAPESDGIPQHSGWNFSGPAGERNRSHLEDAIQAVTKPKRGEWPTYNGVPGGNRYSALDQINTTNVGRLQLQWVHSLIGTGLETTPLVSDGVMYVTAPGQVCALDSRTGREIWCYTPRRRGPRQLLRAAEPRRGTPWRPRLLCNRRRPSDLSASPHRRQSCGMSSMPVTPGTLQRNIGSAGGGRPRAFPVSRGAMALSAVFLQPIKRRPAS